MNKIKILQFITPVGFYGAERWVHALANNANPDEMICDLAVTREGDYQDLSVARLYPESSGAVHYLNMKGKFDFRVVWALKKIIQQRNIDVIHTHGYKSDILGLLAARLSGIKCVSTPHGFSGEVDFKLSMFIRFGAFILRYFDAVAPLSTDLVEDIRGFNVPEEKIKFIRNGVDLKEIDGALAGFESGQAGQDVPVIGFVGQMIPRKNVSDLLFVFDRLYQSHSNLSLRLLGDGWQRAELEKEAAGLSSSNAIEFLGFREDRLAILSQFNLFVMTSSLEGIPRCMMEAMAVGVPVVAYDIPGVDQLIEHNVTGMMVPYGDQVAMAHCCAELLSDKEKCLRLVKAARKKIDTMFSAKRMAEEYRQLFEEILDSPTYAKA